ncbi:13476_t:CDS:2, partial [Dentiscutata erythropus]
ENPQVTRLIKPQIFLQVALSPIQTSCFIIIGNRDEILKFLETHSKVPIIITTTTTTDKNISQVGIEISISPYNKKPIGPTALGTSTSFNWIKVLLPNTKCKGKWIKWAENVKIWYFNLGITLGEVKEVIEKESWFW